MKLSEWNEINEKEPPKNTELLGYDVYYRQRYICYWDGKLDDHGEPRLLPKFGGDDVYIKFWANLLEAPKDI